MKKIKGKPTDICKNCSCVCVPLCTTMVHSTVQSSSDNRRLILQAIIITQMLPDDTDIVGFNVPLNTLYIISRTILRVIALKDNG